MTGTPYFHRAPYSRMEEFAILKAIRASCRVIAKGIMPEPEGITIITETPIEEKVRKSLELIPLEDL